MGKWKFNPFTGELDRIGIPDGDLIVTGLLTSDGVKSSDGFIDTRTPFLDYVPILTCNNDIVDGFFYYKSGGSAFFKLSSSFNLKLVGNVGTFNLGQKYGGGAQASYDGVGGIVLTAGGLFTDDAIGGLGSFNTGTIAIYPNIRQLIASDEETVILDWSTAPTFPVQIVSSLADGTAPFNITSTTKTTNLNADRLDDKHIGTSGSAVPDMSVLNEWSGSQVFKRLKKEDFNLFEDFEQGNAKVNWFGTPTISTGAVFAVSPSGINGLLSAGSTGSSGSDNIGVSILSTTKPFSTSAAHIIEFLAKIDRTDKCCYRFGLGVNATSLSTDGMFFKYDTDNSDTHWILIAGDSDSSETIDSNTDPDTDFHLFKIVISGSRVEFFIDGTSVGYTTTAANIETAALGIVVEARARDVSTAATLYIDYMQGWGNRISFDFPAGGGGVD